MKFSDYHYERPQFESLERNFKDLLEEFRTAASADEQDRIFTRINELRDEFVTQNSIAEVRHSIDTSDEFYDGEQNFFDEINPRFSQLKDLLFEALIQSPFRTELEQRWGKQIFTIARLSLTTFKPEILDDLAAENHLRSEHTRLIASAKIEFKGQQRNLAGMVPFEVSTDRATRKKAAEAKWSFFEANSKAFERIYDDMVKVRSGIAKKLGHDNYITTSYARLLRSEYDAGGVAEFRAQVREHIVPAVQRLRERQAQRLGVDKLKYYDELLDYKDGNPEPQGQPEWIIRQAQTMYNELAPETGEFFTFLRDNDLMDLVNKANKAPGGFCISFPRFDAPFIFSNFNGTSADIDVLTHEAGHAFQNYRSFRFPIPDYYWPTYEACEIHSMSMEFFAWPWMKLFFKDATERYKFAHLSSSLNYIPYIVAVDEFQHYVYANPDASPADRNAAWRSIEETYLPFRDYDEFGFLERGGSWQRQSHIFAEPFYYIDYALAQICAFQFWQRSIEEPQQAWTDYLRLCDAGGSLPFLELVSLANLRSPFDKGCVQSVVASVENWLDTVDDSQL